MRKIFKIVESETSACLIEISENDNIFEIDGFFAALTDEEIYLFQKEDVRDVTIILLENK